MNSENALLVDLSTLPRVASGSTTGATQVPHWPVLRIRVSQAPLMSKSLTFETIGIEDIEAICRSKTALPTFLLLPNGNMQESDFFSRQMSLWISAKRALDVCSFVAEERLDEESKPHLRLFFLPKRALLLPPHVQLKRFLSPVERNFRALQEQTSRLQQERNWPIAILLGDREPTLLYFTADNEEKWTPQWEENLQAVDLDRFLFLALNSHLRKEHPNFDQASRDEKDAWLLFAYAQLKSALLLGDKKNLPVASSTIAALGEELTLKVVNEKLHIFSRRKWKFGFLSLDDLPLGLGRAIPIVITPGEEKIAFQPFHFTPERESPYLAISTLHTKAEKRRALDCIPYQFFWKHWQKTAVTASPEAWKVTLDDIEVLWLSPKLPAIENCRHVKSTVFSYLEKSPSEGGIEGRRLALRSIEIAEYSGKTVLSKFKWTRPSYLDILAA